MLRYLVHDYQGKISVGKRFSEIHKVKEIKAERGKERERKPNVPFGFRTSVIQSSYNMRYSFMVRSDSEGKGPLLAFSALLR
jgi:hypothetical protein